MSESSRSLILVNQYFVSSFDQRRREIDETIKRNSRQASFEKYIILLENS